MESDPIELSEQDHLEEYDDVVNNAYDDYEEGYNGNSRSEFISLYYFLTFFY